MNSYLNNVHGTICIIDIKSKKITKLTEDFKAIHYQPFWINEEILGYFMKIPSENKTNLVVLNTKTKKKHIILRGDIHAPSVSPDGNYLVYSERNLNQQKLSIYSLANKVKVKSVLFDLPGFSAYSFFSVEGKYLYFSHYLDDTNFDGTIDARDHSVIFRVEWSKILNKDNNILIPEQLTSTKQNCNFPYLTNKHLFLTCAIGKTLDIYRLPKNGILPDHWKKKEIWDAFQTARSYEQRLQILTTIRSKEYGNTTEVLEKIISDHLQLNNFISVKYYISQLQNMYKKNKNMEFSNFFQIIKYYIEIKEVWFHQPGLVVSDQLKKIALKNIEKIRQIPDWLNLKKIINAYVELYLGNIDEAWTSIKLVNLDGDLLPLEKFLAFNFYKELEKKKKFNIPTNYYPKMFNEESFDNKSKLFYAYSYLKSLDKDFEDKEVITILEKEINSNRIDKDVKTLFVFEKLFKDFVKTNQKKENRKIIERMKKITFKKRSNSQLISLLHIRVMFNLIKFKKYDYLGFFSSNWLNLISTNKIESNYALEQYKTTTMEEAYDLWSIDQDKVAQKLFYMSVRQTDSLQSHYEFTTLALQNNSKGYLLKKLHKQN